MEGEGGNFTRNSPQSAPCKDKEKDCQKGEKSASSAPIKIPVLKDVFMWTSASATAGIEPKIKSQIHTYISHRQLYKMSY
jgi:hypothetical protein